MRYLRKTTRKDGHMSSQRVHTRMNKISYVLYLMSIHFFSEVIVLFKLSSIQFVTTTTFERFPIYISSLSFRSFRLLTPMTFRTKIDQAEPPTKQPETGRELTTTRSLRPETGRREGVTGVVEGFDINGIYDRINLRRID